MPDSPLPRLAALFAAATAWGAAVSVHEDVAGEPLRLRARGSVRTQLARGLGSGLSAPWPMVAAVVLDAARGRAGRPAGRVTALVGLGLLAGVAVEPVTWGRRRRSGRIASTVVANLAVGVLLVATGRAQWRGRGPASPAARRREVERLLTDLAGWARSRDDVDAVCLVGSYARGQAHAGSDVDVVVLTPAWAELAADTTWFARLRPGSHPVRSATWGPVLERRFRTESGLLVELGLTSPAWARLPLDAGTRRVLGDGHRVLHDPHGLLARARGGLGDHGGGQSPRACG